MKLSSSLLCIACTSLALYSCTREKIVSEEGIFGNTSAVIINTEGGTKTVDIFSDGNWNASLSNETRTWVSITGPESGNGNGSVSLKYKPNTSLPRVGTMYVASDSRATIDTVLLKQPGITPALTFTSGRLSFSNVGSSLPAELDTNIPVADFGRFSVDIQYDGIEEWLDAELSSDLKCMNVTVLDNTKFESREAVLTLTFSDEWGESRKTELTVHQSSPGGTPNTELRTFAQIREMLGGTATKVIEDDIAIEGLIISDKESQNMGDCPEISATAVDYGVNDITAYIESADGSMGFKLMFNSGGDNLTTRYSKTRIWLKGATLRKELDPERYTIENLGADCFITIVPGDESSLPVKKKYMKDLADNDIYTYVTLKKCEFPIRRGGLVMFYNDSYTGRMTKFPQIISDIYGNSMRLLFNLKSPIFSTFTNGSPKGQGPVRGIIVHEKNYRLSPTDGDMGRYQIRNVSADDIQVSSGLGDSYSVAFVEWADNASDGVVRRVKPSSYGYEMPGDHWVVQPTSGMGAYYVYNISSPLAGQWPVISSGWYNNTGLGAVTDAIYGYNSWWNEKAGNYNYAIWRFSTKDIVSDLVTFCLAGRGHAAAGGVPYWNLDYSVAEGATWKHIAEFTIPAQSAWSPTTQGTFAGETPSFFVIPNDILGLDVAMIRMIPSRDIVGTAEAWDGARLSESTTIAYTDLGYSAIRYKKN